MMAGESLLTRTTCGSFGRRGGSLSQPWWAVGLAKVLGTSFALLREQRSLVDAQPRHSGLFELSCRPRNTSTLSLRSRTSFSAKLEPKGQLSKQDLENDSRFGTSHIDQFTWKQVLDMFSCTECGRCSSNCPATATNKPLAPRQLLLDLRDYLYRASGRDHRKEEPPSQRGWRGTLGGRREHCRLRSSTTTHCGLVPPAARARRPVPR